MAEPRLTDRRVTPVRQAIALRLDPEGDGYTGSVEIVLKVAEPVRSFRLHAHGLTVGEAAAVGPGGALPLAASAAGDGLLELVAERAMAPGEHRLTIRFANAFNPEKSGLFRAEHAGVPYLFTQFEELYARTAFPCWDEPAFKIPFQLTLEVPAGCEALSNGPVASERAGGGWRTVAFRETPPIPTYLVALAVGPLESVAVPGLPIPGRVAAPRGEGSLTGLAAAVLPPVLAALEGFFGSPYPYEKLDLVAVPEFWWGAMEHPGLVTFRDSVLLADPLAPDPEQRRMLVRALTHELAHMWFGNLVTIEWWDELWLKESFADWVADKIADQVFPGLKVGLVELEAIQDIMAVDARRSTKAIRSPVASEVDVLEDNELVYLKGKAVLGMLEPWLGPEVLRRGIRDYLAAHAWGVARSTDLWGALARASGRDVERLLRTFLDQPGLPLVSVEEEHGALVLRQRRLLADGGPADGELWELPVALKLADGEGVEERTVLLRGEEERTGLGGWPRWLHPDRGARGYYRWRLPVPRLLDLAGRAREALDPRERIGFLGNALALLRAGEIGGAEGLRLLAAFAGDPEAQVVTALVNALRDLHQVFVGDDLAGADLAAPFAAFLRRTLAPAAARVGWQRKEGEEETVTRLRSGLLALLGREGEDEEARRQARRLAAACLEDAAVDPALVRSALTVAAAAADGASFAAYRDRCETASPGAREHYLVALGAFPAPLPERALGYALAGPDTRATDLFFVAKGLKETAAGRAALHAWLRGRFHEVLARIPRKYGACMLVPLLASGASLERLEATRAFFARPENQVEGWREELAKAAEEVAARASLRRREGAAVAAWLRNAASGASPP